MQLRPYLERSRLARSRMRRQKNDTLKGSVEIFISLIESGKSYEQIGQQYNLSRKTIGQRLNQAYRYIRRQAILQKQAGCDLPSIPSTVHSIAEIRISREPYLSWAKYLLLNL